MNLIQSSVNMLERNDEIKKFIEDYPLDESLDIRIPNPKFTFKGDKIIKKAIASILAGKNILLVGPKSTGKNVLAENLCKLFSRPMWNVSFHVNIDSSVLIGTDTLKDGEVVFRKGPVARAAEAGGFLILDEINMARNEALAALHSILDYRRLIDIPGYDIIKINPATRFIATMNYNYEGTRELNEALLSRFVIIDMPIIEENDLAILLKENYQNLSDSMLDQVAKLFYDINKKAEAGEISETAIDLRGIFDSLDLFEKGLEYNEALGMCLVNKVFDPYEKSLIEDVIKSRFKNKLILGDLS